MPRQTVLALTLAAALLFAGCLGIGGDDEADSQDPELQSKARTTADTGGIQGVVTDPAIQPIDGATITLSQTGDATQSAQDGSFAFSEVQPASYTMRIEADGFIGTEQEVTVRSGQVSTIDIIIAQKPSIEPFSQAIEKAGFVECSVRAGVGFAACAVPNLLLGNNATNDKFLFDFPLESNPWQMVSEMSWDANQPLGSTLDLIIEPNGISNDVRTEFGSTLGESPLVINTDRKRFAEIDLNTTRICNGEMDDPGPISPNREAYCNRNYVEEGGEGQARVFVSGPIAVPVPGTPQTNPVTLRVGFAVQQEYDLVITAFYNAPACEEYSIFNGNTCDQMSSPPEQDPADEVEDPNGTSS